MAQQVNSQINSQIQDKKFNSCLVVSRHELTLKQKEDIENICNKITITPELPVNSQELKQAIEPYEVIIGSFPIQIQIEVLKNKKNLIMFVMKSLGVSDDEEEAKKLASQYEGMSVILTPSKPGEKYRTLIYEGLKLIKEIRIIDEWLIQHSS